MGLCTSRSSVTLDPSAHTPGKGAALSGPTAKDGESVSEITVLGEGILMVQPVNGKHQGGGGDHPAKGYQGGGGGDHTAKGYQGGGGDHTAKGYLELGGKRSGGEGEEGEEEEDEEGDVEELINFLDSEGSLHSELLE